MKKTLALGMITLFLFSNCQKDIRMAETESKINSTSTSKSATLYNPKVSPDNDAIITKIRLFAGLLEKIERKGSLATRSSETMSADSVVWNIEALMNARYADADKPFKNSFVKTEVIKIPMTDGMVDYNALPAAVEETRQKIANHYTSINGDKHIIAIDLAVSPIESLNLTLEVTSVIGEGEPESDPFGAGDDWIWGAELGRCNPRVSNGKDAAIRIQEELNKRFPNPNVLSGGRGFFIDEVNVPFAASDDVSNRNPNDNPVRDNIRDFLLYWTDSEIANFDPLKCLNPDDMNWYYGNTYSFISTQLTLTGKSFIAVPFMEGSIHAHISNGHNQSWNLHRGSIDMGRYIKLRCREVCSPSAEFCYIACLEPINGGPM